MSLFKGKDYKVLIAIFIGVIFFKGFEDLIDQYLSFSGWTLIIIAVIMAVAMGIKIKGK